MAQVVIGQGLEIREVLRVNGVGDGTVLGDASFDLVDVGRSEGKRRRVSADEGGDGSHHDIVGPGVGGTFCQAAKHQLTQRPADASEKEDVADPISVIVSPELGGRHVGV